MLKRLHIRNFRNLDDLEIDQLRPVNVIGGRNNSGKTSLLEALFLLSGAGSPQLVLNENVMRVIAPTAGIASDGSIQPWKELFVGLDTDAAIVITAVDSRLGQLSLNITTEHSKATDLPVDQLTSLSASTVPEERVLMMRYSGPPDVSTEGRVVAGAQGIRIDQPAVSLPFTTTILLSRTGNAQEDAVRLGRLRQEKRGDLLLDALRVIEPKLQNIEDNSAIGVPMIWGDVGMSELIPLSVMGEGMTRLARIVLGIVSSAGGLVLVDEIENGFHHSILPDVWTVIDRVARESSVQVFAATHSYECVVAAQRALSPESFRYHRLELVDSKIRCLTYEPDAIEAAITADFEVR